MRHSLIGHAIVSADGFIADTDGRMPQALMIEADWLRFQAELDAATLTLLGRLGHEAHPNVKARRRLVATTSVANLTPGAPGPGRVDLFNPEAIALEAVLDRLFPEPASARVGVVGGTRVFDLVLETCGFARFDLVVARAVTLGAGRPCFSAQTDSLGPQAILKRRGYRLHGTEMLDAARDVILEDWRPE